MGPAERKDAGNSYFKEGKWEQAAAEYTAGLEERCEGFPPDQRGLLFSNRSQCWFNLGRYQESLEDANSCLTLLPEHTKSLYRRAMAQEKLGCLSQALTDFARVARADPQNRAAVQSAQRLRDKVFGQNQQVLEEALPRRLLEVLQRPPCSDGSKQADASTEEQVEVCSKLRALCVQGQAGLLLNEGAVDVLLRRAAGECQPEIRKAVLACLVAIAAGGDSQDRLDLNLSRVSGPLPVSPAALDARYKLRRSLSDSNSQTLLQLLRLCREDAGSMRQLAVLIGHCLEPEDESALTALDAALTFSEGGDVDVPRAGVVALAMIFDTRRRLGKSGKAVIASRALLKCLESALGTTSCSDVLQVLLAEVFALLADDDRPKGMEVDLPAVGLQILEPFLQTQDPALRSNGLAGLSCLLAASAKAATRLLQQSQAPLSAVLEAISRPMPGPEGLAGQAHAAECLLLAASDQTLRQHWIDGGGIDLLLTALTDSDKGSNRALVDAKLVAVLAIVAAHSRAVRDEVFERIDFMAELRFALDVAGTCSQTDSGEKMKKQARLLSTALCESCACLALHGEFKEMLKGSKKTLAAMQTLATQEDLSSDARLSFFFASLIFNLCRCREDRMRKKTNGMADDLADDDLKALEEFYERMPAESRPAKNGETDAGSKELAKEFQTWCVQAENGTQSVVPKLGKCAGGSSEQTKALAAMALKLICNETANRRFVVSGGGVRTLLHLVDLTDETARDAARQALAQICIVTNPAMLQYSEQLDAVRPLMQLLEHRHELLQFEGAMGLTNLLSASDDLRSRALQADGWRLCRDLVFSDNEQLQRAGLEAMCNFCMAPEVLERFADGKAELELKLFGNFCNSEDKASQIAASGALAMITGCPEVALKVAECEACLTGLLQAAFESEDPAVQHRVVVATCNICETEGCPDLSVKAARKILQTRCSNGGFCSEQAQALAESALKRQT